MQYGSYQWKAIDVLEELLIGVAEGQEKVFTIMCCKQNAND